MTVDGILTLFLLFTGIITLAMLWVVREFFRYLKGRKKDAVRDFSLERLDDDKVRMLAKVKEKQRTSTARRAVVLVMAAMLTAPAMAQGAEESLMEQPGILITLLLIFIPLFLAVVFLMIKALRLVRSLRRQHADDQAAQLADHLMNLDAHEIDALMVRRSAAANFTLSDTALSGAATADDQRGLVRRIRHNAPINFVASKRTGAKVPPIDPALGRLVIWFLGCATFWLLFGTTVGEYLGIKFVAPDVDHANWLSFGKLRPVHTNAVFWGWSSLAMLGLAYYVVPVVSNVKLASIRHGYISLVLINLAVIAGSVGLMVGINNGGGEYREYPWPFMALFGIALVLTLRNFFITIGRRKTREIYISNWYIVSAIIFTLVIAFIAYWPTWQDGLGETIVQGYYMHQGVGMWFMLFTLGLVYYFLPQQLNKPIYSYSLGILAFWTQILFYTLIGTHHFVFSAIPWWLQTVAIVGSAGMLIPVTAGTVNFLMTFRGSWSQVGHSYILPFFLVGIVFYFTGSYQGTAEAFRYTNLLWHFTDFTVAHSHLTMYGIIAFLVWGSIYALLPRITGREPSQLAVGAHFWMAFVGLMFYTIPLMIGGTLKGLQWMEGGAFIESVKLMAPFWLWRAIGGTLMWLAHLVFAFNFYRMITKKPVDVETLAFRKIGELKAIA